MDPVKWAEGMRDMAATGEEAYNYHQLAEQWALVLAQERRKKEKGLQVLIS